MIKRHVLIAAEDPVVRGSLAAVLESEGFVVDQAAGGAHVVMKAVMHVPDLVLLDLDMPRTQGWAVFEKLTSLQPFLPLIVITSQRDQLRRATGKGADALMEKPLNIPALLSMVRTLTGAREEADATITAKEKKR